MQIDSIAIGASKDSGKDEVLLESWIKELEQGIQGMSNLAGVQSTNIVSLTSYNKQFIKVHVISLRHSPP